MLLRVRHGRLIGVGALALLLVVVGSAAGAGPYQRKGRLTAKVVTTMAADAIALAPTPLYEVLVRHANALASGAQMALQNQESRRDLEEIVRELERKDRVLRRRMRKYGINSYNTMTQFGAILAGAAYLFSRQAPAPVVEGTVVWDGFDSVAQIRPRLRRIIDESNLKDHPRQVYHLAVNFALDLWIEVLMRTTDPQQIGIPPVGAYIRHDRGGLVETSVASPVDTTLSFTFPGEPASDPRAYRAWVLDGCRFFVEGMGQVELARVACEVEWAPQGRRLLRDYLAQTVRQLRVLVVGDRGVAYVDTAGRRDIEALLVERGYGSWRHFDARQVVSTPGASGLAGEEVEWQGGLHLPVRPDALEEEVTAPLGPPVSQKGYRGSRGEWIRPHGRRFGSLLGGAP